MEPAVMTVVVALEKIRKSRPIDPNSKTKHSRRVVCNNTVAVFVVPRTSHNNTGTFESSIEEMFQVVERLRNIS